MRLENKVALITGGTTGIGLATARLFAAEGARVFVTGSTDTSVAAARDALAPLGVTVLRSDAADLAQIAALVAQVGSLDVLFLNAGIVGTRPLAELDEAEFDRMYALNVKGPYFTLRAAIPHLRPGGAVILNASINASLGMPGSATYAGTKAAVRALGRVAAAELAARGVRVNVISPGAVDSGIIDKGRAPEHTAQVKDWLRAKIPLGRLGTADEAARAVLFLACEDSSFITGEELVVDGGWTRIGPT